MLNYSNLRVTSKDECVAVTRAIAIIAIQIILLTLALGFLAKPAMAQNSSAETLPRLQQLERDIWTKSHKILDDLERSITREIQIDSYSAYAFYLLSHLKLREFTNSPEDLALVRQASELAQHATELEPKSDYGYIALAETLDTMGQPEKAVNLLNSATAMGVPPTWRFYFNLARLQAQSEPQKKILNLLKQALSFTKSEPEIIIPYVVAMLQTSFHGQELSNKLSEWNRNFPHQLFKQSLAISLTGEGKYKQAHTIYNAIYSKNPTEYEAMINDSIIHYKHLNNPSKALSMLSKLSKEKVILRTRQELLPTIYQHLATIHIKNKNINLGQKYFIESIKRSPDQIAMISYASDIYNDTKQAKHLHKLIRSLTEEIPATGLLYAILGETQSEDLKDQPEALKSFANAILLDPNRSDFYNGMGLAYYRLKLHEKAFKMFEEASLIDPTDATAKYNGACVLSQMGKTSESLAFLEEALNLNPNLASSALGDSDFNPIRKLPSFKKILEEAHKYAQDNSSQQIIDPDSEQAIGH